MNPDGFLADVLAEPETLDGVLDAYAGGGEPPLGGPEALRGKQVVFIGMGSSRFAALTVAARLRTMGIAAVAEYASTDAPTAPGSDVVAVGISASGSSAETVEALARHHGVSRTVAITNRPDRALAAGADVVLPLLAGEEAGGVACKTFQATLAILWLVAGVPVDALRPAVDAQRALLDARGDWLEPLVERVADVHTLYTVAPASRISSALEAALMLREGPRIPADAAETGDWSHVDVYLSKYPGYTALLFGGSAFEPALFEWATPRGADVIAIGRAIDGATSHIPFAHADDPVVASLVEVSAVELLAATLWRRRLDAGRMP